MEYHCDILSLVDSLQMMIENVTRCTTTSIASAIRRLDVEANNRLRCVVVLLWVSDGRRRASCPEKSGRERSDILCVSNVRRGRTEVKRNVE